MENAKFFNLDKKTEEFIDLLNEHNGTRKGYRIITDTFIKTASFGTLYYDNEKTFLFWGKWGEKQGKDEKLTICIDTPMYDISKIEEIEEVKEGKTFIIHMTLDDTNNNDIRSIVTVEFMED